MLEINSAYFERGALSRASLIGNTTNVNVAANVYTSHGMIKAIYIAVEIRNRANRTLE